MKTLIIYAHPNKEGNNGLILKNVKNFLKNTNYEILDLYSMKYKPVLEDKELYTQGKKHKSKTTKKLQDKISESDKIIVIYPVWWNNMPAILKGFFEKIITPGFAFKYKKYFGWLPVPIGLLKDKKAVVFLTTNSPKWIYWTLQGRRASKTIKNDLLGFCGVKTKVYHLGHAVHPENNKEKITNMVRKGLKQLMKK